LNPNLPLVVQAICQQLAMGSRLAKELAFLEFASLAGSVALLVVNDMGYGSGR